MLPVKSFRNHHVLIEDIAVVNEALFMLYIILTITNVYGVSVSNLNLVNPIREPMQTF